ncbi:MAG TPA: cytochrome P450 [Gillisia sp.]|nr:cytochrome P450 [Gillisia sp.]
MEDSSRTSFSIELKLKSLLPKHNSFYAPFGAEPRKCIGNNFAMFEMILAIAELIRKYKIEEKSTPIEISPLITLKLKNAILRFEKR